MSIKNAERKSLSKLKMIGEEKRKENLYVFLWCFEILNLVFVVLYPEKKRKKKEHCDGEKW